MGDNVPKDPSAAKRPLKPGERISHEEYRRTHPKRDVRTPIPAPDWSMWGARLTASISEAVALSLDLDPAAPAVLWESRVWLAGRSGDPADMWEVGQRPLAAYQQPLSEAHFKAFRNRLEIAGDHARERVLASNGNSVRLAEFARWANERGWTLPTGFPSAAAAAIVKPERRWPWGTHETLFLQALATAGTEFFGKPGKKPQKKVVQARLKELGVESDRTAEEMAKILCG